MHSQKSAIILVAFGSTVPETRETYARIEKDVREAFPDRQVRWGYTSRIVRERLKEQGVLVADPQKAIDDAIAAGVDELVVQSLHVMPGEEFSEMAKLDFRGRAARMGAPLLSSAHDIREVADILGTLCRADRPNVLVGHGNEKMPELNAPLLTLATLVESRHPDTVLCTVEGPPGPDPMRHIKAAVQKAGAVHFVSLMMISGVHVRDDLMGDDPESWRNLLGVKDASLSPPLGDLPAVRTIILRHLREATPVKPSIS